MNPKQKPVRIVLSRNQITGKILLEKYMKGFVIFSVMLFSALTLHSQNNRGYEILTEPVVRTDMLKEYAWDGMTGEWVLKNSVKYDYTFGEGETQVVTTSDFNTGVPSKRVIYQYTSEKILLEALYQDWRDGVWADNRRDIWVQNSEGLNIETIIQYYLGGEWKNITRYTDYQYEGNRLSRYTFQSWNGTDWVNSFHDSWHYDENGQLILRTQIRLDGTPVNRFTYDLDDNNLREMMTIFSWNGNDWAGFTRRIYEYNRCGSASAVNYQDYKNGEWINTMRHEYVYTLLIPEHARRVKVPVCHRGHTIYVSINAVDAHLAHGDCLGKCLVEERGPYEGSSSEGTGRTLHPLTVFPNPAADHLVVRLNGDSWQRFDRVELADYTGNVLRSIVITDGNEIDILRGSLKPGVYYLRLQGVESFSQVVIFK